MRQLFHKGKKERPELSLVRAPSLLPTSPSLPSTMAHIAVGIRGAVVTESLPTQVACPGVLAASGSHSLSLPQPANLKRREVLWTRHRIVLGGH